MSADAPSNMASEVSSTRLYLGNLPAAATKADIEQLFQSHGHGEIVEVKLMNGFGFVEYKDPLDARDVVPAFHGYDFMGNRLIVQFARGSRRNDNTYNRQPRNPVPRRTPFRMQITGLPEGTSWQDLKDFARSTGRDVVYSEVAGRDGKGSSFVEYETEADLRAAVEKLDNAEFKSMVVRCTMDISDPPPQEYAPRGRPYRPYDGPEGREGGRYRSRSPAGYRQRYPDDPYYRDRRGYTPPRDYRRRSPPRGYYEDRYEDRRGPRPGAYPPRRDDYAPYNAMPPRYEREPYTNGYDRMAYGAARPPSPPGARRPRSPGPPRDLEYDRPPRAGGYY